MSAAKKKSGRMVAAPSAPAQRTSRHARQDAIRAALLELADQRDGRLTPRAVLDAARDERSPLHEEFSWDDDEAAEGFRLIQAGALLRRVKIQVVVESKDPTRVNIVVQRAFPSVPSLRGSPSGSYVPLAQADQQELLSEVVSQLEVLRKKYAAIEKLAGVWKAVDDVREDSA